MKCTCGVAIDLEDVSMDCKSCRKTVCDFCEDQGNCPTCAAVEFGALLRREKEELLCHFCKCDDEDVELLECHQCEKFVCEPCELNGVCPECVAGPKLAVVLDIGEVSDELHATIERFERYLKRRNLGIAVEVRQDTSRVLEYKRQSGKWQLIIRKGDELGGSPLVDASREDRITALDYFKPLMDELEKRAGLLSNRMSLAIQQASDFLDQLEKNEEN